MEISIITARRGGGVDRRDVQVLVEGEPSLGDVLIDAGVRCPSQVVVDGRRVAASRRFTEVCRAGAVVEPDGVERPARTAADWGHVVRTVGGLGAGVTHHVGQRSEVILGRCPQADVVLDDPTVSRFHARLRREGREWFAEDLGSHNGTAVDGRPVVGPEAIGTRVVRVGATAITVGPVASDVSHVDRPGPDGAVPFNRPPRPHPRATRAAVDVPDPPAERRRGAAFSLVALVGPILIGVVMVQVLGSMRYALFALLAPVMMITNAVATRRRNTKDAKSSARRFRRELAEFDAALAAATETERARREQTLVDLATLVRRAEARSVRTWERRAHHEDHLVLRLGSGTAPWEPPVDPKRVAAHAELRRVVAAHRAVEQSALELSLAPGGVVGIVGDRAPALAVARSLVIQATVLHGPSDVGLAVVAVGDAADDWDWVKWLPHTRAGAGRLLARGVDAAAELLGSVADALAPDSANTWRPSHDEVRSAPLLLVADGDELTTARRAPAREFLRGDHGPVAGIVIAASAERLPSSCTAVVQLDDGLGAASLHDVASDAVIDDVVVDGLSAARAEQAARAMAPFTDPDLQAAGGDLPARCALLDVLGIQLDRSGRIARSDLGDRGLARARPDALTVPIGMGADGPVTVDLVADGPHALVGGTTGSGKSEFLRSLVGGLASRHRTDDVVFVLIDYKGGAAFDACAALPHTVGLVTDLDGHLAERALRSLEAELHHRERVLRDVGAADLVDYRALGPLEPLPRLVLVVDEFATLAAELPDFMDSLVGIAQRGRSLGVHMVLATQRPAGAVNADIKANTNIRVALRMQDERDSVDVIDAPDAAAIDRHTPGRALVRLGPGELVAVQTPLSTAVSTSTRSTVMLTPFRFGDQAMPRQPDGAAAGDTDLDALVAAVGEAHRRAGQGEPRRPWLEMLTSVRFDEIVEGARGSAVPLAIADDPDRQRRVVASWEPAEGHLALVGAVGSGTSAALRTAAMAAVGAAEAPVHVYGVDYSGELGDVELLDACGAVVGGHDHERQRRLVDLLRAEVARRRASSQGVGDRPRILFVVDDLPAWLADHGDARGHDLVEDVRRLFAEGPSVGLAVAFTTDRTSAVPMRFWGAVTARFLFRHADPDELTSTGLRRHELPEFTTGRAVDASTRLVVQFPDPPQAEAVHVTVESPWPAPMAVESLPDAVRVASLGGAEVDEAAGTWLLPVGLGAAHREVALLPVRVGDGVLVAGPARSGVSTMLETLARQVRTHVPAAVLVAIAGDRSPLSCATELFDAVGPLEELTKVLDVAVLDAERPWFVIMDDAHLHDDPGALEPLLRPGSPCRVVVGGRSDHLHGSFGHWTRAVRRSSTGVLLNPRLDTDGDLLGVRLPRHVPVPLHAGRGFLVADADARVVQFAS